MNSFRSRCSMRLCVLLLAFLIVAPSAAAQNAAAPSEEFFTARITAVSDTERETVLGMERALQTLTLRLEGGPDAGKEISQENGVLPGREDTRFAVGERVVVSRQTDAAGTVTYLLREKYRIPQLLWLTAFFVVLALAFGGLTGVTSLLGLGVSIGIIIGFVIPRIIAGSDPLLVSLAACGAIACTSLYLAHGFHKRTSIALLSTVLTLTLAAALDVAFVHIAKIFGMGSEESMYLQTGLLENVNLRGLLLGGILIGCLGVLDDVTTAQTAAIDEISKANPRLTVRQLQAAGQSVGREHIASLINTLALAYAGASLPLLLLLHTQGDYPLWVTVNGEFFAEEIVRTLVGSSTLLLAVPISTWLAAFLLQGARGGGSGGRIHHHHHGHTIKAS